MRYRPFRNLDSMLFESQEEKKKKERAELMEIMEHKRKVVLESVERLLASGKDNNSDVQLAAEYMRDIKDICRKIPTHFINP
jgi:hypothetical protein